MRRSGKVLKSLKSRRLLKVRRLLNAADGSGGPRQITETLNKMNAWKSTKTARLGECP